MVMAMAMLGTAPAANAAKAERHGIGNTAKWINGGPFSWGTPPDPVAQQTIYTRVSKPATYNKQTIQMIVQSKYMRHRCDLMTIKYQAEAGGDWKKLPAQYTDITCTDNIETAYVSLINLPKGWQVRIIDKVKWKDGLNKYPKHVEIAAWDYYYLDEVAVDLGHGSGEYYFGTCFLYT